MSSAYFKKFAGIVFIVCLLLVQEAEAHSPLIPGDNERLSDAMFISDPTKSWAIYGELHGGGKAQYYRFEIGRGQSIYVMLFKSTNPEERDFLPSFALMGPGINSQGNVPGYVEQPAGAGIIAVTGELPPAATYEPFGASSFYSLAELEMDAPESGTYYIAVYEPSRRGSYGLAVGKREEFSLGEWFLIPLRLISIYRWEGQSFARIFLPIAATFLIGLIFWRRAKWMAKTPFEWTGTLAGLLFLGTGIMFLFQMVMTLMYTPIVSDIIITIILSLLQILLGVAVIRVISRDKGKIDIRDRIRIAIFGILALFLWAGFLIGPILALLTSIMPARTGRSRYLQN